MSLLRDIGIFCLLFLLISAKRVERQVSFGFPTLGNPNGGGLFSFGRPPQDGRQSIGGLVNSFLGGLLGQNQGNRPTSNQQNQFGRPPTSNNNNFGGFNPFGGGGGFDPCRNNGGCEHKCEPLGRRRRCRCNDGYVLNDDFRTCIDIDECNLNQHNCQHNCINTIGSFKCSCRGQAILLPDLRSCGPKPGGPGHGGRPVVPTEPDVPSCDINNGGCEHRCLPRRRRRIKCKCNKGFKLARNKKSCDDVDECALGEHTCSSAGDCLNTLGSFSCREPLKPVASCDINNGGCHHKCKQNNAGRIICSCRRNFSLRDDKVSCEATGNPCDRNNGRCQHECVVENNNKICKCRQGFELLNGRRCVQSQLPAVDPCQKNNGRCQHTCVNSNGEAECHCRHGFQLVNKRRCQPVHVDPCAAVRCHHQCRVVAGQAECYCNDGFFLVNGECILEDKPFILPVNPNPIPPNRPPLTPRPLPTPKPRPPSLPNVDNCGVNPGKSLIRRIVGGKPADPKDWPWMAAILKKEATASFCGGVLIAPQFVLTAAHCVFQFTKDEIAVRLGEYDFEDKDATSTAVDLNILEIRMHEKYDTKTQQNDIAILKLDSPILFNPDIFPVCLPEPEDEYAGKRGYVVGWGTIYFGGPVSTTLQEVIVPVWEDATCKSAYEGKIMEGMMCAGVPEGGKDSCQGDSGGPYMMQKFPSPKWFVAGVVSWGIECASPNRPGVYTRVNKFLDWIAANSH